MDLTLIAHCPADCNGTPVQTTVCYWEMIVSDGSDEKTYFAHYKTITVGFDDLGYTELRVNRANTYRYTLGDTFGGAPIADSEAMYDAIVNALQSSAPPVTSFYILAENNDILNAENNDKLRQE